MRGGGRRARSGALLVAVWIAVSGWACRYIPIFEPLAPTAIENAAPGSERRLPPRRVVLISLDGLAPWVLAGEAAPTLRRLAVEGVSAAEAVTISPPVTLPSHVSMLSGVGPELHGVSWNRYQPWSRLRAPTLFTRCAQQGLRCDLFASKRKFVLFAANEPGVRQYRCLPLAAQVFAAALASLEDDDPDLVVMHLSELDRIGHRKGWGSEEQRAAIGLLDSLLGQFLPAAEAASERPLTLLITADHGGYGRGHLANRSENRRIPWILWGDGVDPQAELRWISTLDTAATVSALLEMEIPPSWLGQPRGLFGGLAPLD